MPSIPSDMVAVIDQSDQRFWVYFVDTEGIVSLYKGPEPGLPENAESNPEYVGPRYIKFNGETPVKTHPESPKVAVVDYVPKGGKWETRIYYLNEQGVINEACWTQDKNDGKWYKGALNSLGIKATPGTLLTAAVDDQWLKVYYQRADGKELWVAWVVPGVPSPVWSSRRAVSSFQ